MAKRKRKKPLSGMSTEFCVATGRPSWHQARAGHSYSGLMCFSTREKAEEYERNFRKHHPNEPAFILEPSRGR